MTEDGAYDDLLQLADRLAIPVTETQDDLYDNFPADHPLFLGQLEAMRYPRPADLLMSFGEYFQRRGQSSPADTDRSDQLGRAETGHDPDILARLSRDTKRRCSW